MEVDEIEYPGDEYITLFPVFVSLNFTLSKDSVQINQQRLVGFICKVKYRYQFYIINMVKWSKWNFSLLTYLAYTSIYVEYINC